MSNGAQKLQQAKAWLVQYLSARGAAGKVAGVDIGQVNIQGRVGYALRIFADQNGVIWLSQQGFPGTVKTPVGRVYVAVVQQKSLTGPGAPAQPDSEDPYKGWQVEYHGSDVEKMPVKHYGTDVENAKVKYSGTDVSKFNVEVHGTGGVAPKPESGDKEFRMPNGAFGTSFSAFEPTED